MALHTTQLTICWLEYGMFYLCLKENINRFFLTEISLYASEVSIKKTSYLLNSVC